jgi:hypothetical protein
VFRSDGDTEISLERKIFNQRGNKMKPRQRKTLNSLFLSILIVFSFLLFSCADSEDHDDPSSSENGSVSFRLAMRGAADQALINPLQVESEDICVDYDIGKINAVLTNSSGSEVAKASWDCSKHKGTLSGIPPQSGLTLAITGLVKGNVYWQKPIYNVSISAGKTKSLGTIEFSKESYKGPDEEPPAIEIHYTADGESNVSINDSITITFTEKIAVSSLNACTMREKDKDNTITSTVSFKLTSNTVTIDPTGSLQPNTEYTVTIPTTVHDIALNHLENEQSWKFATAAPPVGPTPPVANTGVDQSVPEGALVTLDGSGSTDADGTIENYFWEQTDGRPPVALSDASAVMTTFTAPEITTGTA